MRGEEDVPDITVEEALNNDEEDEYSLNEKEVDEMKEEYEEMREGALMLAQAATFSEMLMRSEITLKEYDDLVEKVEKIADEKGATLP